MLGSGPGLPSHVQLLAPSRGRNYLWMDSKMTNAADTSTEMTGTAAHLVRGEEAGPSREEELKQAERKNETKPPNPYS